LSRVLVTGATGFIGRQALAPLRERGFEVHAVARRPGKDDDVTWHKADLLEPGEAERVVDAARPTHLLHFAWFASHGEYWTSLENVRWVEASLRLLRAFHERGGARAVFVGTCAEYDWDYGWCSEDVTPLRPRTLYGVSKNALRLVVDAFAGQTGLSAAWGRIFFLYGPHEHPARLVSSVSRALIAGEPAPATHDRHVRDFLHVADVADAFAALLASDVVGAVNVGSGEPRTVMSVLREIGDISQRPDLLQTGAVEAPPSDPLLLVADIRRLRNEVVWRPARTFEQGIAETVDWWRRNRAAAAAGPAQGQLRPK
jgi:nucleoside-diphosphate-sugar epimerase